MVATRAAVAAVATCTHHSALRGQETARAGEEGHEDKHDAHMLCVSTLAMDEFRIFSTMRQTRILMRSFSIRFEWRSVPGRCFWLQFAQRGSHLKSFFRASLGCDA